MSGQPVEAHAGAEHQADNWRRHGPRACRPEWKVFVCHAPCADSAPEFAQTIRTRDRSAWFGLIRLVARPSPRVRLGRRWLQPELFEHIDKGRSQVGPWVRQVFAQTKLLSYRADN